LSSTNPNSNLETNSDSNYIEFKLSQEIIDSKLITRIYAKKNIIYVGIKKRHEFPIEFKPGAFADEDKRSKFYKKLESTIKTELNHYSDLSKDDMTTIELQIKAAIADNMEIIMRMVESKTRELEYAEYAKELVVEFYFKTLGNTKREIWWYNKERGIFQPNGEKIIESRFQEKWGNAEPPVTIFDVKEAVGAVHRQTFFERSEFDKNIEWIACTDCMINLRTGITSPFSPDFLCTVSIPVQYHNPNISKNKMRCPRIIKFLFEIVDKEDVARILDFLAYCLWRDYRYGDYILLIGDGQNGKSVLLQLIRTFLGLDNVSAESLDRLLEDRFSTANLYRKLANIEADISKKPNDEPIVNTGKVKKLTGRDPVTGEFKYRDPFTFTNYAKLWFSCNTVPRTDDLTDAFFRRVIVINFSRQFWGSDDEKNLIDKLTTEDELSGLLHILLDRLPRILKEGIREMTEAELENTYKQYMRNLEPIQAFLEELVIKGNVPEQKITKKEMYEIYKRFCVTAKLKVQSAGAFSRYLSARKFEEKVLRDPENENKPTWYWVKVARVVGSKADIEASKKEGLKE
jgi:putative DNA primase/helicase